MILRISLWVYGLDTDQADELPLRTRAVFLWAPSGQALTLWLLDQKEAGTCQRALAVGVGVGAC